MHACSLIYVFEVFIDTKKEKRVGHKDGGFTIYDKLDSTYCFDSLEQVLEEWGYPALLRIDSIYHLIKLLPAIGNRQVLREFVHFIDATIAMSQQGKSELEIVLHFVRPEQAASMDLTYPFMRFAQPVLEELNIEGEEKQKLIQGRVGILWRPFIIILTHTVLNCLSGKLTNKYFKPFFSDAENLYNTYIGQLNLEQIVEVVGRTEHRQETVPE